MTNYRRYRLKGGCYFFTVALTERRGQLLIENIQGLRAAFREVKQAHPFTMEAVVILPDHLHCIWTLPEGDDDFSTRWRQIKTAFSRQLPNTERRSQRRLKKGERGIWQRRFWEHAMRDEVDYQRRKWGRSGINDATTTRRLGPLGRPYGLEGRLKNESGN